MADERGNPNVFTTFKGKYTITPASAGVVWDDLDVMLTCVNDVQLMGDCKLTAVAAIGFVIGTLPVQVRPTKTTAFPIIYENATGYGMTEMGILPNGNMVLGRVLALNTTLRLHGLSFNISKNWY